MTDIQTLFSCSLREIAIAISRSSCSCSSSSCWLEGWVEGGGWGDGPPLKPSLGSSWELPSVDSELINVGVV